MRVRALRLCQGASAVAMRRRSAFGLTDASLQKRRNALSETQIDQSRGLSAVLWSWMRHVPHRPRSLVRRLARHA
jgi:hypothetical protein